MQYIADNPGDVNHKMHKDADVPEFKRDPSWAGYIESAKRQFQESKSKLVTDTPNKLVSKSLRQLHEEDLANKACRRVLQSPSRVSETDEEITSFQPPKKKKKKKRTRATSDESE